MSFSSFLVLLFVVASQANTSASTQEFRLPLGEPAEIRCSINDSVLLSSQLILAWKYNGVWLTQHRMKSNNRTVELKFKNISFEDHGIYVCGVFNFTSKEIYTLLRNVSIQVGAKPTKPAEPNCFAVGWPPLTIMLWTVLESGVETDVFLSHTTSSKLCLDEMKYFRRIPHCRQVSEHSQQSFNCSVTQYIKELLANRSVASLLPFLCATIRTWNDFGHSFSNIKTWDISERFSLCPKPEAFQVVEVGHEEIDVSWRPPRNLKIASYHTMYYRLDLRTMLDNTHKDLQLVEKQLQANDTYNARFTGLKCNTGYVLSAACTLAFGGDPTWGMKSSFRVFTKQRAPSKPIRVEESIREGRRLKITWKLPYQGTWCGSPRVVVRYWKTNPNPETTAVVHQKNLTGSPLDNDTTLQDLDSYATYNFTVIFCNDVGCADSGLVHTTYGDQKEPTAKQNKEGSSMSTGLTFEILMVAVVLIAVALVAAAAVAAGTRLRRMTRLRRLEEDFDGVSPNAPEVLGNPDTKSDDGTDYDTLHLGE